MAVFFALFGRIYEEFSYGVYSMELIYAFSYALVFGCIVRIVMIKLPFKYMGGNLSGGMYNCGIITLTAGAVIDGMATIYGTVSRYTQYYTWTGAGLMAAAFILYLAGCALNREEE